MKVTDVKISKATADTTGTLAGSPAYIAPEVFHYKVYDSKADIYSLGIMLWEVRGPFLEAPGNYRAR